MIINIHVYISYELIRSTYSKSNQVMKSPVIFILLILSVESNIAPWKHQAEERCFDVIVFTLNKWNTGIMKANENSMRLFFDKSN